MNRGDLTPRQRVVVEATEPVTLVLGGAGTGKTTVALWTARAALEAAGAPWHRVLFLTFSRTAVAQLITRSRGVLADIGHRVEVATFHGFAYRLLRDFGRYAGWGDQPLEIASEAQIKLLGDDGTRLRYDDLVPGARALLDIPAVRELVVQRWPVVICDEFQDTSNEQWELLGRLSEHARLILLADPNQMIYASFVPGVGPERLTAARELAGRIIELEPTSHRDPTGAIPALAEAIRCRDFTHDAVAHAHATNLIGLCQVGARGRPVRRSHRGAGRWHSGQAPAQQASSTCSSLSSCHRVRPTPPVLGVAAAPGSKSRARPRPA